jgi:hypothetical protein
LVTCKTSSCYLYLYIYIYMAMYYFILTRACCTRVGGSTSVRVHSFVTKRLEDESYAACRPGEDSDGATLHLIYQAMCVRAVWVRDRSIYRFVLLSIGTCRPVLTLSPCGLINFFFKKKKSAWQKKKQTRGDKLCAEMSLSQIVWQNSQRDHRNTTN